MFRWAALTARGAGQCLDPHGRIDYSNVPLTGVLYTKDNLQLNDCIIGMEEQFIQARRADPEANNRFVGSIECVSHTACLGAKAAISNRSELPKQLTKLGHLLESPRTAESLACEVDSEFTKRFRYRRCVALPAGLVALRAEHKRILELCRPCRAHSVENFKEEEELCDAANANWAEYYIDHWCVVGSCPMQCNNDAGKSRRLTWTRVIKFIKPSMVVPLEYRWKGMEQANAKVYSHAKWAGS